jgi:hypothetical protein
LAQVGLPCPASIPKIDPASPREGESEGIGSAGLGFSEQAFGSISPDLVPDQCEIRDRGQISPAALRTPK